MTLPVCPLCHERCGKFLCPCCGAHNEMPWKCDICKEHTEPCMVMEFTPRPVERQISCVGAFLICATLSAFTLIGIVTVVRWLWP